MTPSPSKGSASRTSLFGPPIRTFFRGLAAILPLAATGALISWAVVGGESLLRTVILDWFGLPPEQYWPGMGFVLSLALVFLTGLLMFLMQHSSKDVQSSGGWVDMENIATHIDEVGLSKAWARLMHAVALLPLNDIQILSFHHIFVSCRYLVFV